ncbi:MAG: hypothetical protein AB7O62_10330 [Pirellulales bacterium]
MRYSLRALFGVVTLAAMLCAVLFAAPALVSMIAMGLMTLCITPACVAGIVYGRGKKKAFAIGCITSGWWVSFVGLYYVVLLVANAILEDALDIEGDMAYVKTGWAVGMAWIALSGLVSVGVRWLVRPSKMSSSQQPGNGESTEIADPIFSGRVSAGSPSAMMAHEPAESAVTSEI